MKLFLVHCGYYDQEIANGIYEFHVNVLVPAMNADEARARAKASDLFRSKKMHVDGVQEIESVEGFRVELVKDESLGGETRIHSMSPPT